MIIGIPKEIMHDEARVAATPDSVKKYVADGHKVLVEKGAGSSFLPDYVTEEAEARGTITRLQIPDFEPELWKQLLYHRNKWVSPQMQAAISQLASILQGAPI